jgi:small-conductance mechanosensitive channel
MDAPYPSLLFADRHLGERRGVFKIGVVYETPADKLERIPRIIEEVVRAQPRARFDRAHFFEYGDFSLVFEVVYYVYGADYVVYMDTQQAINLGIYLWDRIDGPVGGDLPVAERLRL